MGSRNMYVLGISGGLDTIYETDNDYHFFHGIFHDAAAVLTKDNEVIAAIEEERLSRNKHTNRFPYNAIKFVLDQQDINFHDLHYIAVNISNNSLDKFLKKHHLYKNRGIEDNTTPIRKFRMLFKQHFNVEIPSEKFQFVEHHITHAASVFYMSGFEKSLIMTLDGDGEGISSMFLQGNKDGMYKLGSNDTKNSLGHFYTQICGFLGYSVFEEYKVMGLAPYGNPQRFMNLFKSFYELQSDGQYLLNFDKTYELYNFLLPRKKDEPLQQIHKDIAASLQVMLEHVVLHICQHYQNKTKNKNLCIAGGVGQNSKMNGVLLKSGLFEKIFVQPASHDSGCAIGAALEVAHKNKKLKLQPQIKHVYWGTDINKENMSLLDNWSSFINFRPTHNSDIASLLAQGAVIGWVQGRAEFGPRALGNRSIIADPRPVENKDRINAMVKKREGYRPFAPSVIAEAVSEFFVIPNQQEGFQFMSFVVDVQPLWREKLGAITHVDGTARIQTVEKSTNPKYWDLIEKFGQITDIPILLNTSLNNNAEPIVDNILDAITCYLTSDLDFLVINDYLIEKNNNFKTHLPHLTVRLPHSARLRCEKRYTSFDTLGEDYYLSWNYISKRRKLNQKIYNLLSHDINKDVPLNKLMESLSFSPKDIEESIEELFNLWSERWIIMSPPSKNLEPSKQKITNIN